jgi:hypothetical protein
MPSRANPIRIHSARDYTPATFGMTSTPCSPMYPGLGPRDRRGNTSVGTRSGPTLSTDRRTRRASTPTWRIGSGSCHSLSFASQGTDGAKRRAIGYTRAGGFPCHCERSEATPIPLRTDDGDCRVAALLTRNPVRCGVTFIVMAGTSPGTSPAMSVRAGTVRAGFIQGGSANGRCGTRDDSYSPAPDCPGRYVHSPLRARPCARE